VSNAISRTLLIKGSIVFLLFLGCIFSSQKANAQIREFQSMWEEQIDTSIFSFRAKTNFKSLKKNFWLFMMPSQALACLGTIILSLVFPPIRKSTIKRARFHLFPQLEFYYGFGSIFLQCQYFSSGQNMGRSIRG